MATKVFEALARAYVNGDAKTLAYIEEHHFPSPEDESVIASTARVCCVGASRNFVKLRVHDGKKFTVVTAKPLIFGGSSGSLSITGIIDKEKKETVLKEVSTSLDSNFNLVAAQL